eukprot:3696588-Pyramimonas_sp.AAC.1
MEEEPAVFYLWHKDNDKEALQRALKLKTWVDAELQGGRNPFSQQDRVETPSWHDTYQKIMIPHHRQNRSSKHCSTMATYVDDCELDAQKRN